jgi:uncharacterized protein (AIM24 family)
MRDHLLGTVQPWMTDSIQVAVLGGGLPLWHLAGTGRAWVELAGDLVMHKLTAGQSLRVRPRSLGMCDPSIAIQLTQAHAAAPAPYSAVRESCSC